MLPRDYEVTGQTVISSESKKIASDQIAFVRCRFSFSEDWDEITERTAQFAQEGRDTVECILSDDNECDMPQELKTGYVFVSVFGYAEDGTRATTVPEKEYIYQSGYTANGSQAAELTPDLYAQLLQKMKKLVASSSGGSGGIGFFDWKYDDEGYLHILDADGEDVLDPLYIGKGADGLTEEQVELAQSLIQKANEYASSAETSAEAAGTSAEKAAESAAAAKASESAAADSAAEAKATEERIQKVADSIAEIENLEENTKQVELFAEAAKSYATTAQTAATKASESQQVVMEQAEAAEAARQSAEQAQQATETAADTATQLMTGAEDSINTARDAAIEKVEQSAEEIIQASSQASTSAANAKTSEENAALSAEQAAQVAEKNGYFYFEIEDGHLMETRTDNVSEDLNFELENGRLIAVYE